MRSALPDHPCRSTAITTPCWPGARVAMALVVFASVITANMAASLGPSLAAPRNATALTLIAGAPDETTLDIAHELSTALDDGSGQRIMPVVGRGGTRNVEDLLKLDSFDLAVTQVDALDHLRSAGSLGPRLDTRIGLIAKLHEAEMHVLAAPGIDKLEDLSGKTVNLCPLGSGTEFTARTIFNRLGIKVRSINVTHAAGLAKVAAGEIAATVLVTGKPARTLAARNLPKGVKLIGVPYPAALESDYLPSALTADDYPGLITGDKPVETIAVGVVLAAMLPTGNDDRDTRIAAFVGTLFAGFNTFQGPTYHPKWRETNLAATVPSWTRHPAAVKWLEAKGLAAAPTQPEATAAVPQPPQSAPAKTSDPVEAYARANRAAAGNPVEQERLFKEFLNTGQPTKPKEAAAATSTRP